MYVKTVDLQHQDDRHLRPVISTQKYGIRKMQLTKKKGTPETLTVKIVVKSWKQEP